MKFGLEKSMEFSGFLRSLLVSKSESSIETSGTFFFIWKMKIKKRVSYSSQFYTGQPGWCLKLECVPDIRKKEVVDMKLAHLSVLVSQLKGHYDDRLPPTPATLCITLVNEQSSKNVVTISTCWPARESRDIRSRHGVEGGEILMKFQLSYDDIRKQHFMENDEILFKLEFKPLPPL